MTDPAVTCPKCLAAIAPPPGAWSAPESAECPRCRSRLTLAAFPRLRHGILPPGRSRTSGQPAREGEAVCRFYPGLQAETVCEECGCLMSSKAAVDWAGHTLCLPCLHQLREAKGLEAFSSRRTLPENVALALVVLLAPVSLFTAPAAAFHLLRHRKAPRSLIPRSRFRWWLALGLSLAVTAGWVFLFVAWIAMMVRAVTS